MSDHIGSDPGKRSDELKSDGASTNINKPDSDEYQPPPLSIQHLIYWTVGTSLLMAVYRGRSELGDGIQIAGSEAARTVTGAVMNGVAIGSLMMMVSAWLRRQRFPVQPGEWYLVVLGINTLISLPCILFIQPELNNDPPLIVVAFVLLPSAALNVLASVQLRRWRIWCTFFASGAFLSILIALLFIAGPLEGTSGNVAAGIYFATGAVWFFALLIAFIYDIAKKRKRGWVHRTGVILAIVSLIHVAVIQLRALLSF